jgi:hypothetical protein
MCKSLTLLSRQFKTIQERGASDIEILAANDIGNMIAHLPEEAFERALDAGQFMDDVCSTWH